MTHKEAILDYLSKVPRGEGRTKGEIEEAVRKGAGGYADTIARRLRELVRDREVAGDMENEIGEKLYRLVPMMERIASTNT